MEHHEAKTILELHRPGSIDDQNDPLIAEALRRLETDPELRDWFDAQQAVDDRIAGHLAEIKPPSDLKTHILAGMRAHAKLAGEEAASAGAPDATAATNFPRQTAPWRSPWVGIAAVFAILFVLSLVPRGTQQDATASNQAVPQQASIPSMIEFLAAHIAELPSKPFDKRSEEPDSLKTHLNRSGAPSPSHLPAAISKKTSIGCFTLDYQGIKMGMICFQNDRIIHLTTVRKSDCMGQFPTHPVTYETRGQAFRVWTQEDEVYILSTEGSKENLPEWI